MPPNLPPTVPGASASPPPAAVTPAPGKRSRFPRPLVLGVSVAVVLVLTTAAGLLFLTAPGRALVGKELSVEYPGDQPPVAVYHPRYDDHLDRDEHLMLIVYATVA